MSELTKQVQGMEITLDPRVLEDWDIVCALTSLLNADDEMDTDDVKDSIESIQLLTERLYGKQFDKIKKRLRKAHGGYLPISAVADFIGETFEVFQKN